ncbi:MAG TPA: cytochrome P450, partial [Acidimicrobiales bacterium]|nr:cytochrome P450 [Acidimicrobiales bacterium]
VPFGDRGGSMSPDATAVDITSHDTYVEGIPHEVFAEMRATEPVAWTEEADGGRGFWSLTKYDDVLLASRSTQLFSSRLGIRIEDMDPEETEARRTMMEMDAPEHTKLRRLVSRPFAPKTVAAYEDAVRGIVVEILDSLQGEHEFNFVSRIARELPMRMLGSLLGLPDDDLDWLVSRGDALIGNTDPDFTDYVVDQVDTSDYRLLPFRSPVSLELFEYANQALEERRITPTHDILSALLEPTTEGETLDDLALKNFFTLMVAAGNDTTRYTMTGGLLALIERPELLASIPSMTLDQRKSVTEEMLRWTTVTMHFRRTLIEDLELRGKAMKSGDKVVLWYASANFDEEHFEHADEFRPDRTPNDHVTFGLHSPHLCLGAHLARLEIRVLFEELASRWKSIELTGEPERLRSNFISGIKTLPITVQWQ